ncbi:glycosyltransferase family 39 protein [Helicobacter sp. 11S02596-1]|uniref:ArnT family glycosyltransferase n=1 Tax=Helicobacter sp. 11S02596-1 TaxID=1476194 RepID=UPI000BA538C2|nr:glycosyltransferase family 39 protein [Helicobacter sp. 11S02596-1]PAF43964.1 hypothetical protein BJI48_04035 [Helicobacter sp. 11S02596-1]
MIWKDKAIYLVMFFALCVFAYMDYRYLDIQFLGVTGGDELPEFHQWLTMYEGFRELNIEKIFRFGFYNYGFGWYLLNLLVTAPFHLLHNTEMAIYAPRVLNGVFSVACLWMIYKICRLYLPALQAYGIVFLVVLMPGFWSNGYLVKPDVFQAFFILWGVYLLARDNFGFGKAYLGSVFVFGLAVGVAKFQAVMFFPLLYAYVLVPYLRGIFDFKKFFIHCVGITASVMALWVITNPYLLHPRGMGAWWGMFVFNMESNATNHGAYTHVSLAEKIFGVIDFYYFEIIVFIVLLCVCLALLWGFISKISRQKEAKFCQSDLFVVVGIGFLVSLVYLLFGVNKVWGNYYVSTIYLGVLLFIPMVQYPKIPRFVLPVLLVLQIIGGGGSNHGYEQVFKKYDKDLSDVYAKSTGLVEMLEPIVQYLRSDNQTIEILTDFASFEYQKLGLKSVNIHQMFGSITPDRISQEAFLKQSNSKNLAFFVPIDVIVFSKDNVFFSQEIPEEKREETKDSLDTIEALNKGAYGFKKTAESKDFIIYSKDSEMPSE